MHVEVKVYGSLKQSIGQDTLTCEVPTGTSVTDMIRRLTDDYPALTEQIYENNSVRNDLIVTRNKTHIQHLSEDNRCLDDGDVVRISEPITGGKGMDQN
jgi:molybdopterin converting factor small subunit